MNLYEFYSRTYDPQTGTWLGQDKYRGSLADPQTLHRYTYVNNSPINFKDNILNYKNEKNIKKAIYKNTLDCEEIIKFVQRIG